MATRHIKNRLSNYLYPEKIAIWEKSHGLIRCTVKSFPEDYGWRANRIKGGVD